MWITLQSGLKRFMTFSLTSKGKKIVSFVKMLFSININD